MGRSSPDPAVPPAQGGQAHTMPLPEGRFAVKSGRSLPKGAVAAPRLKGTGLLRLSPEEAVVTGNVSQQLRMFLLALGIGLVVGFVVTLVIGVDRRAVPGSPVWTLLFLAQTVMIAGLFLAISPVFLRHRFTRPVRMSADPGFHHVRFNPATGVLGLELDDGHWAALKLVPSRLYPEEALLERLRSCYGDRLTIEQ